MALAAEQADPKPLVPSPAEILKGYDLAVAGVSARYEENRWCWQVVTEATARLGSSGELLLRIARYRQTHHSLHGYRIGMTFANSHQAPSAKGKARAEIEMHECILAAYEKWEKTIREVAENLSRANL